MEEGLPVDVGGSVDGGRVTLGGMVVEAGGIDDEGDESAPPADENETTVETTTRTSSAPRPTGTSAVCLMVTTSL